MTVVVTVPPAVKRLALALAALNWVHPQTMAHVVCVYHDGWWPGLSAWQSEQEKEEFEHRLPPGPLDGAWPSRVEALAAAAEALGLEPDREVMVALSGSLIQPDTAAGAAMGIIQVPLPPVQLLPLLKKEAKYWRTRAAENRRFARKAKGLPAYATECRQWADVYQWVADTVDTFVRQAEVAQDSQVLQHGETARWRSGGEQGG